MASFPDLRPKRRLATAGVRGLPASWRLVVLAVLATLSAIAFLAVSELATLRGTRAHVRTPAFLTQALGSSDPSPSSVRKSAPGISVSLSADGYRVGRRGRSLGLTLEEAHTSPPTAFLHGLTSTTGFGRAVVVVTPKKTEQYLVVAKRHGKTTWRWRLDTLDLRPRLGDDGWVGFVAGHRLIDEFAIGPPNVRDTHGRDVTPSRLRWTVARRNAAWWLELELNDSRLPTPYIIDPATYNVGVGTNGSATAAANIALAVPAGVKSGDLLIAHVAWLGGTGITSAPPVGWTQILTTQNDATNTGTSLWYKKASATDVTGGGTYGWTFTPNAIATGGIAAYTGIDGPAPLQVTPTGLVTPASTQANATVFYPSITPTTNGDEVLSVVAWAHASSGTNLTPPLGVNGTNTEHWETVNAGAITSELSDFTQSTAAAVATNGSNSLPGGSGKNLSHIAFRVALKADTTPPTSAYSLVNVSPAKSAYYPGSGTTIYYRGTGPNCAAETQVPGKCSFALRNTVSDAGSGPASSQFGALGGTSTGWSFTGSTASTPSGGPYDSNLFAFSSGTSSAPTEAVIAADNGGNTDAPGTTFTLTNDTTSPTVAAPTVTAGYYSSLSVPVTKNGGADTGGSGIDATTSVLERDVAPLSNGACGLFSGTWTTVTLSGGNDTGVTNGQCYEYRERLSDNVGNQGTSVASSIAKVDNNPPADVLSLSAVSGGAFKSGNTIYYRGAATGGGSFKITNGVTDSESGPASSATAALGATTTGWTHTPSTVSTPVGGPYVSNAFSWTAGTTSSPTEVVTGADVAGNTTASSTLAFSNDSTAPVVAAPSITGGYYTTASVAVTTNGGVDTGGSGVDATTSVLERDVATLSNGTCGGFSGTWTTVTLSGGADTDVTNGHCYEYREKLSDNVGNQGTSGVSAIAKVDAQAPTNSLSISSTSPSGAAFKSGSTVYYRGSASAGGSFQITNAVSDSESGAASSATGVLGGTSTGWTHTPSAVSTPSGGPYVSNSFGWSAGTTSSPTEVVTGADAAGNTTASATLTFTNDSTAPSTTDNTTSIGSAWRNTSATVTLTPTDGGSGVSTTYYTTDGSTPTTSSTQGTSVTLSAQGVYTIKYFSVDNVGNAEAVQTAGTQIRIDLTAPTNAITLTGASPAGSSFKGGSTVYYRGAAAGSFQLRNTVADTGGSGAGSSATAALGGTTTGWTHTPSTVSTPSGGPFDSNAFSWSSGATSAPTEIVTGSDVAGNTTASAALTFTNDSTAPSVTAPSVTAGYYTSASVPVSPNGGTDGGSGVNAASSQIQRDVASLSGGSCGAFPGTWANVTLVGGNDTSVTNGHCYEYRQQLTDNVGNVGNSSASNIAKVDTQGPTNALTLASISPAGTALKSGATVYYRGSATGGGSFKLTNTVTDGGSGPSSSATAALGGTSTGWTHTASTVSTPAGGPFDSNTFTWAQETSSSPTEVVTGADVAGNSTAAAALTFTPDSTAPTAGALTVNGTAASAGGSSSYSTSGSFTIGVRTDYAESQSATQSGLASSTLTRESAAYSSADTCGSFTGSTPISGNPDQNGLTTGCYRYILTGTDNVGNTVTISTIVKVDTSAPSTPTLTFSNVTGAAYYPGSGTRVYFRPAAPGGGGFQVTGSATDSDTGVAYETFPIGATIGTNWTDSGGATSSTYSYTPTATSAGTQNVTATNNAGGVSAPATFDVTADSSAPAGGALTVNGTAASGGGSSSYSTSGAFAIGLRTDYLETQSATASGLASSTLMREAATFSSADVCGTYGAPTTLVGTPAQSGLTTGCYRYTMTGTDNVGNAVSVSTVVKVDTSVPSTPTLSFANVVGGAYYSGSGTRIFFRPNAASGSFDVTASSTDGDTSVASYQFPTGTAVGTNWSATGTGAAKTFSYAAGATTTGSQTVTATNNAGGISSSATFDVTADSSAPTSGALSVNGTAATGGGSTSYSPTGSFAIGVRTDYTETASASESGLASSTLTRANATFSSSDTCGTFGSPTTLVGSPAQSGLVTGCYRYTLTGTDNVGNAVSVSTIVKVDTTVPSTPTLSITNATGGAYYSGSGAEVFFKPTAASGSFDVTASSTDGDTGVASYQFPTGAAIGTNWSGSGSGATRSYSFTPTATTNGSQNVTATNTAGGVSANASFTVTADSTAPTTSVLCNGSACLSGTYYTSSPVSVTLSGNDGSGSGVQKIRYTTDGSDPTPVNGADYAGAISISSTTTVKFRAFDNLGNEEAVGSETILLDGTPPTGPTLSLSENPATGAQHVSGTTLFYRPGAAGTFRVSAATSDPETGITSVSFPSVANVTGGGTLTGTPYQMDYTWGASTSDISSHNVVATNGAGTTSSAGFTFTPDSAAPAGQTITLTGSNAPYYKTASVSFSLGDGSDAGSGVDTATRTVTRETAPLSGDTCGTFVADGGTFSSPDTAVSGGHCYRYTFTISDNVGNTSTAVTATAKVDTVSPLVSVGTPSELTGAGNQYYDGTTHTQYFRPAGSGSFALSATASDSETAVTGVDFPDVSATTGWSGSTGGTDPTSPYTSPASYAWTAGAGALGAQSVTATDKAGNTNSDTITITADATAPTGQTITLNGANTPYFTTASVAFNLDDGTDSGSGLDTSTRTVTRETAPLSGNTCGTFTADAGTYTSPDTTVTGAHCYRYTFTITDRVGNTSTPVTTTAKVDTTEPSTPSLSFGSFTNAAATGTTVFFRQGQTGSFTVTSSSSDAETGVASTSFPGLGSGWTTTAGAYNFDATAGAPTGNQNVTSTNGAGSDSAASPFTVVADSSAPTTAAQCNGTTCSAGFYTSAPVSVTLSADDGSGSGVQKIRYTTDGSDPTPVNGADYTGAISISSTTTVKFRAYDRIGNEEAVGSQLVQVDTSAPSAPALSLLESSPAEFVSGTTLFYNPSGTNTGTFDVAATTADPGSGIAKVTFPALLGMTGGGDDATSPYQDSYSWDNTATVEPGTASVTATNGSALTNSSTFEVREDTSAPTGQSITLTGANPPYFNTPSVTFALANGADTGSGVDASSSTVTRETAPLVGDSCGTFASDAGPFSSPDTSVSGGHCYRYAFTIADNVGNVSASVSVVAKVDTDAPTVSVSGVSELTGAANQYFDGATSTQFFRSSGSGSFAVDATASDSATGVTGVSFPDVSTTSGWSGSTGGTDTASPYTSPTTYTWTAGAGAPGAKALAATDKAGNDGTATITIKNDDAAPTGQAITLTGADAPWYTTPSVTFALTDGADNTGGSGLDLTTRSVTRETGTLTNGACIGLTPDAGTFTSPDTSVTDGNCYRYTFTIADRVGNVSAAATAVARIDASSPSIAVDAPTPLTGAGNQYYDAPAQTLYFRPGGSGSFSLNATASDNESNISGVAFPDVSGVSGWSGSTGGIDPSGPYSSPTDYSWTPGATAPGIRTMTATNGAGLTAGDTVTIAADSSAPTGQDITLTGPNAPYYGSPSVTFALADGTDVGSGVDASSESVTRESAPLTGTICGTFSTDPGTVSSPDATVTDGHCYRYTFTIADKVGNVSAPVTVVAKVDTSAPDTTIDAKPSDPSNNPTPTFQFSSTETSSTFECSLDAGTWAACASPDTLSPALAVGTHTFDVRATDAAANTDGTPASYTWTIDSLPPDTTIDVNPSDPSNDPNPAFQFSSSKPGSTFECRLDSGSWTSCTTPHTIAPALAAGTHTFEVRATDTAGNTDATPASYTWTIDLTSPTVTITSPTQYVSGSDPANYPVAATALAPDVTKVDFYECSNASAACSTGTWSLFGTDATSPYSALWATPAFDGPKAIRAVATDTAGNTGEHVLTISIDRTAPTGVTVSYPNGYTTGAVTITTDNGTDPDVAAATGALERQTATLTNGSCGTFGTFSAVTSPDTVPPGSCAMYRYQVADNAGNIAVATSSNVVKSDSVAPTSTLTDPGANLRETITLDATASDTGGSVVSSVTFEWKPASGGTWTAIATDTTAPYSASFDTTTVADGVYDFRSVATDAAGNTETSPTAVVNRRIDNTAPSATMLSPGNPVRATVTLTSSTSDAGSGIATVSYELAPHSSSFSSQPATWDTTLSTDGQYDLRVVATDAAGNSTTSALITTRVDNTPPSLSFTSPASGAFVRGSVLLVTTANDASPANPPVSFAYKLHSASTWTSTSSPWNSASLPTGDGLYDLRATATDDAGNTTQVVNSSILVDNAPPSVSITAPPALVNGTFTNPVNFSADATDNGTGVAQVEFFECSNSSVDCASGTFNSLGTDSIQPYRVDWNVTFGGNHALEVVASDNTGLTSAVIRNVFVDRTAPDTIITARPADPSSTASTFTFGATESGSTFECRIDGGAWSTCSSPKTFTGLADNQHTVDIRATDAAGNTDPTPATWTWHRDTNPPAGVLADPGRNVRGVVALTSSTGDAPADGYASGIATVAYEYSANGTTWAPIGTLSSAPFDTINWNTVGITDGVYQLHVVVTDVAGNVTTSGAVPNVRIDNTPPTTSQDDPGAFLHAVKTITGSAADTGSGIDHVDFQYAPSGTTTWTTIGTDTTAPYSTDFDTTTVADGHYDFQTVAVDVAGNQATSIAVGNRLVDNTPPSATMNDPSTTGGFVRGTISLSSVTADPNGTDGSGIASVAYEYSTNGGGTWTPTSSPLNTTTLPDGSLKLHVIATDNAGNATTSAAVTDTIDNTKPVTTDDAPSGYQSSPVTVTLSATDAGSGVTVTEYSVDGGPYAVGTSVTIPAPADGSNDGAHTIAYFSADNAGNIEQVKSATVLIDATPPACPSCATADYLRGTVTLSASPADGGAGIKSVTFQYAPSGTTTWTTIGTDTTGPAPYTADWNTTTVADGHYDLQILVTDNADNTTTTSLPDKVVDNTPPNVAVVGAPTEGAVVSGDVAITASAADEASPIDSVQFRVRGNAIGTDTTAPYSLTWNSTTGADGPATIEIVVTDRAGNSTTSAVRTITVDNGAPTPTLADPGQNLSSSVALSASSDPDTVEVDFQRAPAGSGTWTTIAADTTAPYGVTFDTSTVADGVYDFRVFATDGIGNTGTSPVRSNVRIDNTSPTGELTAPVADATVGGPNVHLASSAADAGSGVASVVYEVRPTGGSFTTAATSTTAPFDATWDATGLASGNYDIRPVVTDRAGNAHTGATVTVNVDATSPTVSLADPGTDLSGAVSLNATVTGNGATQVAFSVSAAGANSWRPISTDSDAPWSASFDTSTVADGLYDLRAMVSDAYGNTSQSVRAGIRIDNSAPSLVSSTPSDGSRIDSASSIELVASEQVTFVNVTLDGAATVAPVVSGTHGVYNTGSLGVGNHTLAGDLRDAAGKTSAFRVHLTVWTPGATDLAPPIEKNTTAKAATTLTSADGIATVTMPSDAWAPRATDWLVLRIRPLAEPTVTNGFAPGTEALEVTAYWALAGDSVHHFNRPLEIRMAASGQGLIPATLGTNGWRTLRRVPNAPTLPDSWDDGYYRDAAGFHLLTRHLSQFTLLRDVQPPAAPSSIRAVAVNGRLSITWVPGADNSGTYDYVRVTVDGNSIGDFGPDRTGADAGPYTPGDSRTITLRETDLAGNDSTVATLQRVPKIAGLSLADATAALEAAGFVVGNVTEGGTGRPGTVTGPAGLALADGGSAIDLTIAPGNASKFVFSVVNTKKLRTPVTRRIAARIVLTRSARVTASLFGRRHSKLYTWRFSLRAGRSIVKLRLPKQVRRPGVYTLRWTAQSGREVITRTIHVQLRRRATIAGKQPIEVVLAGSQLPQTLPVRGKRSKVVAATGEDHTFELAGADKTDVRVVVVDVDQFGLSFVHDLHTVFPNLKIVALSRRPRMLARGLKAGATVALPSSTPSPVLTMIVSKLLKRP